MSNDHHHCTHWRETGERCCDCGRVFPHNEWPPGRNVPCEPPCPDCEELIEEAIQWRDWQSLDMGVYCDKHDPFAQDVEPPFAANPSITWDQIPWELRPERVKEL